MGTWWLWKEECGGERGLLMASYLIASWLRGAGSHKAQWLSVYVCVTVKPCTWAVNKRSVVYLKHQTSSPLRQTHNSFWHIVAFFSCHSTGKMQTHMHTRVVKRVGGGSVASAHSSVCVERDPNRLFSYQDDLLTLQCDMPLHKFAHVVPVWETAADPLNCKYKRHGVFICTWTLLGPAVP